MSLSLIASVVLAACGGGAGGGATGTEPAALSASLDNPSTTIASSALTDQASGSAADAGVVGSDAQLATALRARTGIDATSVRPTPAPGPVVIVDEAILVAGTLPPAPVSTSALPPISQTAPPIDGSTRSVRPPPAPPPPGPAPAPAPAPVAGACGVADVGNWTVPTPSKLDANIPLRSLQQTGSRLFYISAATGSDATGDIYFWDGTRIVDSAGKPANSAGAAYGTDPMNPSAAVKAFKRWAYVGPRKDGTDIGTHTEVGSALPATRAGYPDWWMFKRGETFDLSQDLLSFAREADPNIKAVNSSLALSGGRSATERQIIGAFGDVCAARPRFVHPQDGFVTRYEHAGFPVFKNAAYLSLHFDGHDRSQPGSYIGLTMLYQNASATNILFEDIWFDAATIGISQSNGAQVTLRRSLITDNYSTDGTRTQGIYYSGARDGKLRIEESILLRNGFSNGDPKLAWPPSGKQTWDVFNRNLYIDGQTTNMNSAFVDSVSMVGASGDQFRAGLQVERNFFYQGYVSLGAYGGYADTDGATGTFTDNIVQRFAGSGTDSNLGQPGWGVGLTSGAYGVEVARNIVTGAQHGGTGAAFGMSPLSWLCYSHTFSFATRSNRIHDNIFESPADSAPIGVSDGVTGEATPGCSRWQFAGVKSNTASNNVLISPSGKATSYEPVAAAIGTTNDTVYSGNKLYASRATAATALGWTAPNRTLKTHLQSNGVTVTSTDGFPEYFNVATQLRRGQWKPEWTSKAIVNHVRGGFGVAPLP